MNELAQLKKVIRERADAEYVQRMANFFKTGQGQYAENERFLGVRMPALRQLIKPFQTLGYSSIDELLNSIWHEEKMAAALILLLKYQKGTAKESKAAYQYYASNRTRVNNWDLVDSTAAPIVGHYHYSLNQALPRKWITEKNLWARRIAIVASHYYTKQDNYQETFYFVKHVLDDDEDLIHKAAGWMLREVGKRDMTALQIFLNEHYQMMPRTMLRYAIEHIKGKQRDFYMAKP